MNLLSHVQNRFLVSPFLLNSVPKAGTNLLQKAVGAFPGIASAGSLDFGQSTSALFELQSQEGTKIPIGVDRPRMVSLDAVQQALSKLRNGHYATGHIPFSEELARTLVAMRTQTLLILRDPRDVVVSHARFVATVQGHYLYEDYQKRITSARILTSIVGQDQPGKPRLLSIRDRYESVLPWREFEFNYTTRFEKLVGPDGGGSRDAQVQELRIIADHLGIKYSRDQLERLSSRIYGGTWTFRSGLIGGWVDHFQVEHKDIFKEVAGQTLIDLGYEKDHDW
jgi:hypothetical protein